MHHTLLHLLVTFALASPAVLLAAAPAAKPNVLVIMVDDMGYSDIGCYGSEIQTPNLDRIAASGMKFTQMYNTAKCYTTRACMMTGLYYQRTDNSTFPNTATIGEVLRPVGYHTWWSGKHHAQFNPVSRGFDHFFGLIGGAGNHFYPTSTPRIPGGPNAPGNANKADWNDDLSIVPASFYQANPDFYSTDALTDKALQWLDSSSTDPKPFFLHVAYTAPHWPLQAFPADIAKYNGVYDMGYDAIRNARYQRQIQLGLVDPAKQSLPAFDPDNLKVWTNLSAAEKASEALNMQIYAAMVDRVDQNIGRLLQKLTDQGKLDNTLILFFSDNGACAETPTDVNADPNAPPGSERSFIAYGDTWAQVSNTPLRKWKQDSFEGGIATPFFASWPARITPQSGWNREPVHVIDVLPTMLEIAAASYPGESTQPDIPPVDGSSLLPAFDGGSIARTNPLFFQFSSGAAVRDGRWKIVRLKTTSAWELYDMDNDASETVNLAAANPAIVTLMTNKYNAWLQNCSTGTLSGSTAYNFHTLTTTNGTGTGYYYSSGQQVPISANPAPPSITFVNWTGATQYVLSETTPTTTLTMPSLPALNLSLTANYDNLPGWSTLTVNSGTGSGEYQEGQQVAIAATTGLPGTVFDQWTGDTQYLNNVNSPNALVTLPTQNITLTASYVSFQAADDFTAGGLSGGNGWSGGWTAATLSSSGTATNSGGVAKLTWDASMTRSFLNPLTNATLSFDWDLDRVSTSESGTVEVFNGSTWTEVWTNNIKGDDANGSAELAPSASISLPAGITQIRFTVNGNQAGDAFYIDNVKVAINQAPVFTVKPLARPDVNMGATYSDTLAGSATDANEGDVLTYSKTSGPSWLIVNTSGVLSGQPNSANVGNNVFTIKVADAALAFDTVTLTIEVLPDYATWSTQNQLVQGQQGDDDGDGNSNYFEFVAGLEPKSSGSVFTFKGSTVTSQPNQHAIKFGPIFSGRTYTVKSSESMTSGTWEALSESTSSDAASGDVIERTVTDTAATGSRKFYVIEITKP